MQSLSSLILGKFEKAKKNKTFFLMFFFFLCLFIYLFCLFIHFFFIPNKDTFVPLDSFNLLFESQMKEHITSAVYIHIFSADGLKVSDG